MDSYNNTLKGVDKDMVYYQNNYMESARKKRKCAKAKYAIYGYFFALQYWAYEAIERLASKFAKYHGPQSPRMLSWSSDKVPSTKDLVEIFDRRDVSNFLYYSYNYSSIILNINLNFVLFTGLCTLNVKSTVKLSINIGLLHQRTNIALLDYMSSFKSVLIQCHNWIGEITVILLQYIFTFKLPPFY